MAGMNHEAAKRQEILRDIIQDLHSGADFNEVKVRFAALIKSVKPGEIAQLEQAVMADGIPASDMKRLCEVHAALFQDAIERGESAPMELGHPVETLKRENAALADAAQTLRSMLKALGQPPDTDTFTAKAGLIQAQVGKVAEVEKHYLKKENQLFPVMEKRGMQGPPKIMWAVHDETRAVLKSLRRDLDAGDAAMVAADGLLLANRIDEMIFKEENILFPMITEKLLPEDWDAVQRGEREIGYALIEPPNCDRAVPAVMAAKPPAAEGMLHLDTGALTLEQVNLMLKSLPVDISFVDEKDEVRYYSDVKGRLFPRSEGVIGRNVKDCHPPASVNIVRQILQAFRAGEKDVAEFWLELGGRFIYIRYFAVRDEAKKYRGVMEVAQDVTGIRALEGERRLLNW
jgi:DUF438 domain-containing protein